MALSSKHPLYTDMAPDWEIMGDTYRGERHVKSKGIRYLPATPGMVMDGMNGLDPGIVAYRAYVERSVFHDYVADAVETLLGMMHHQPPEIELPTQMEFLLDNASTNGEGLEDVLRRINERQLVKGRIGLLLDFPTTPVLGQPEMYVALYEAETLLNWDDESDDGSRLAQLNMVIMDESRFERQNELNWEYIKRFRVLALTNGAGVPQRLGVYQQGLYVDTETFSPGLMNTPSIRGNTLEQLPFVFVNSKDLVTAPDDPPLLGLARLALAIYRGEADYRQSLFNQAQDTLVVIGGNEEQGHRIGAGSSINVPIGGDAKFIGVSATGLPEQRQALENDKARAAQRAGTLVETASSVRQSGESLNTRVRAQTATLTQLAKSGAAGLERLLKIGAQWIGADPDKVKVSPNLDFGDQQLATKNLVELMTAKSLGAPISKKSVHDLARRNNLTTLDYEDEMDEIEAEAPEVLPPGGPGTGAGGNPLDLNQPPAPGQQPPKPAPPAGQ